MKFVHDTDHRLKYQYTPWPAWVLAGVCAAVGLAVVLSLLGLGGFVFSTVGFGAVLAVVAGGLAYFGRIYTADFRMGRGEVVFRKLGLLETTQTDIPLEEVASLRVRVSMEDQPTERHGLYLTFEDDDRDDLWIGAVDVLLEDDETSDYVVDRIRGFIAEFREEEDVGADAGAEAATVSAGAGKRGGAREASGSGEDAEFPEVDQWIPEEER